MSSNSNGWYDRPQTESWSTWRVISLDKHAQNRGEIWWHVLKAGYPARIAANTRERTAWDSSCTENWKIEGIRGPISEKGYEEERARWVFFFCYVRTVRPITWRFWVTIIRALCFSMKTIKHKLSAIILKWVLRRGPMSMWGCHICEKCQCQRAKLTCY